MSNNFRSIWNWDDVIAELDTELYQHDFEPDFSVRRRVGRHWVDFDPNHKNNVNIDPPGPGEIKLSTVVEMYDLNDGDEIRMVRVIATMDNKAKIKSFEVDAD